jgi:hypothetical protein
MRSAIGKYWRTAITPAAINDMRDLGVPEYVINEIARAFHALGNEVCPERGDELQPIARPDCRGMFRFKSDPQLRGFVIKIREQVRGRRGTLYLTGVELRTPDTYEGGLTRQRNRLMKGR